MCVCSKPGELGEEAGAVGSPSTGDVTNAAATGELFDAVTPELEGDDNVEKMYGNLSDGEIQVRNECASPT